MVLELKEYTMASLGYKSSGNPLIVANQTRPSPFSLNTGLPPLLSHPTPPFSRLLPPPPLMSAGEAAAAASLPPYFTPPSHKTKLVHTHILITIIIKLIFPTLLLRSSSSGELSQRRGRSFRRRVKEASGV